MPLPLCAECGEQLPPRKPGPGKTRVYCSDRCRKRAERRRKAVAQCRNLQPAVLTPFVDPSRSPLPPQPVERVASPDEQLAVNLLELRMTAAVLHHLSLSLRRSLSWRAEALAGEMVELVDRYFPLPAAQDRPRTTEGP